MALQLSKKKKGAERSTEPMTRGSGEAPRRASPSDKQIRTKPRSPADKRTHRLGQPVGRRTIRPDDTPIIFTVGHSTRTVKEFIALLLAHDVQQLIDVRTIPRSRHNPQFNRDRLPRSLQKVGIDYQHMAALGGLRHARRDSINAGWRNASFRGFADYMQTPEFQKALDQLIKIGEKRRTAIMCAEAVPWRCHRSLIGDALLVRGLRVEEIASLTRTRAHGLTPWAGVRRKQLSYPVDPKAVVDTAKLLTPAILDQEVKNAQSDRPKVRALAIRSYQNSGSGRLLIARAFELRAKNKSVQK